MIPRRGLHAAVTALVVIVIPVGGTLASPARTDAGAPRLTLQDGRQHPLTDFRPGAVVLGFTVPSCDTCVPTLRRLDAPARAFPRRVLTAIAVNVGPGGPGPLAAFAAQIGASRPLFAADPGRRVVRALGVRQLETIVVLDRRGRMALCAVNPSTAAIVRAVRRF